MNRSVFQDDEDLEVEGPPHVEVDVRDGIVTLSGSVTYRAMKHRIEDVAAQCRGVRDVENRIRVRQRPEPEPGSASEAA